MILVEARNLKELWDKLNELLRIEKDLVPNKKGTGYNHRGEYYIHLYDLYFQIESDRAADLYLEELGYASSGAKITHLLHKYLDPDLVRKWISFIKKAITERPEVFGEIYLATKVQTKAKGGCIVGFLYRGVPPTLIVYSRSIEMPAKGAADVLLVSALSRLIRKTLKLDRLTIKWFTTSLVLPSRRAFIYRVYKWPEEVKFKNPEFQKYLDDGWNKYYITDYQFSYSANKRTKALFLKKKDGTLTRTMGAHQFYLALKEYIQ